MAISHASVTADLLSRWPEHRIAPSTSRIAALVELLGSPQRACPVIQIAGTNGKGSTAIMIDALLRAVGLRTGRFSSPHLVNITERITIDGDPITQQRFDELYEEILPYVTMVDEQLIDGVRMTFFEVMTGLAYAAFADAPVDVAIIEVGLGGSWDATNVADASVAVICPIDLDHTHILGNTIEQIAVEKAGIIKSGSIGVFAAQQPAVARILMQRAADVGAEVRREGMEFGLISRSLAVGGQLLRIETADGPVGDLFLPLFGEHMAHNAALAQAAVEALLARPISPEIISEGFNNVVAPARLEVVRNSPTIVVDTAHNPHGVKATLAAVKESFDFSYLVVVLAMMADKDVDGVLSLLAEYADSVVVTQVAANSRSLPIMELAKQAEEHFGEVHPVDNIPDALDLASALADEVGPQAGVLVIGSVIAAGEARALLKQDES